jgi:hypothetical protein
LHREIQKKSNTTAHSVTIQTVSLASSNSRRSLCIPADDDTVFNKDPGPEPVLACLIILVCLAAILTRYEGALRPEDKRWADWTKGQTKKIEDVLTQLETEANSLKGKPTIGTISVACALGYLDYRFAAMDWRAKHPKLAKWFNSISETPAMKATQPPAT